MESSVYASPAPGTATPVDRDNVSVKASYAPPWADVSIIGIAGSSGSGKSTISQAIVKRLNLPWVVILSMVSLSSWRTGNIRESVIDESVGLFLQESR